MCTVFNIEKLIELKDGYKVAIYKVRLTDNYKRNRYCILDRDYEKISKFMSFEAMRAELAMLRDLDKLFEDNLYGILEG